ncbi:glycogen debranching N-terminal domain-containing protein [Streptomyces sp. 549]|uniref:amylo-alpha-1,6-glucosidase n=1 Tax=Streptomyces sp. 549 TaxID=3049076 RepID=UPI0024C2A9CD|nr:glycogen debranching N-terminal domain-containing protein [Streptomyces sp. 549]MDK1474321.1 glycogen debranching N-terminal domain-containing protein [Streptomyces sp. 549]
MTSAEHLLLFHRGTFAAVGPSGDITGARGPSPDGLFQRDARHLSRWQLTVDGTVPTVLVPASEGPVAASVLTPRGSRAEPPAHTVFREQSVTDGTFTDRIRLTSNRSAPETARVALTVDVDFADQFELRSDHRWYDKPHAVRTRQVHPDGLEFGYRRAEWHSRTTVTADPVPDAVEETGSGARRLVWEVELPPHGTAELTLTVTAHPHGLPERTAAPPADPADPVAAQHTEPVGHAAAPLGPAAAGGRWPELVRAAEQGLSDLAGLLVPATGPDGEELRVPAAGVPWFLALIGRHALLTSLFALPYRPSLAAATLPALAATQATEADPSRIAEPGKIVHEVRHGELAHFRQVPYGRYYGSVDSTPLFLVLLGEYTEHTGDTGPARRLERHARAAVEWMFRDGGLDERGYLLYRPDRGGLAHQSWKDSPGAMCFADGRRADGVIAAAAPQGYAWDALRHTARLAATLWGDEATAARLTAAADDLRARFIEDFLMPEHGFPALALDGDGRRVTALASDAGHLLWSGLLGQELGEQVGRRLLRPDFHSGWGIRTLAAGQDAYHPLSYHRGGVWPHDTALTALGLARYGLHEEAAEVARGLVAMAGRNGHRLPEVIAGYGRADHPAPVPYPHACSPQSWAAAAPLALLTAVGAGQVDAGQVDPRPVDGSGPPAGRGGARAPEVPGQPPEVSSSASAPTAVQA